MRPRNQWSRQRAKDRPASKAKRARYDEQNSEAAAIILASPEQHRWFQVDWARRFQRRKAAESGEVDTNTHGDTEVVSTQRTPGTSGQGTLDLHGVSRETVDIQTTWPT